MEDQLTQNSGEPFSPPPAEPAEAKSDWSAAAATFTLIAINVLIFLVMVIRGVSFFSPTASSVLSWGADYGPYTLGGQWWRMFASMFLHFGIIHLFMNMLVLANIGMFMESLSGRVSYLILYVVAGLGGCAASLFWHPTTVSAGASGAIFGLYGGLLGFLVRHRDVTNPEVLKSLRKGALTFVGYNILFGLQLPATQRKIIAAIAKHMEAREEAWTLLAQGLREGDQAKLNQSLARNREADQLAATISGNK